MKQTFDYASPAFSVRFGPGRSAEVADVVAGVGSKALVLSTPEQTELANTISAALGTVSAGVFAEARMHTPVEVSEKACERLRSADADCVVAAGGGSTIGLGKAIAARTGVAQIAIPTTYAGSEMTDILGESRGGEKHVRRDPALQPKSVIYDVNLTLSLPKALSGTSGVNAIAHAVEALYAPNANPVTSLLAEEGIRALAAALPLIVADPADLGARSEAQYGAWLCAMCLRSAAMGLHHRVCHVLGGRYDLPHAETHTIVLPHVVAYNDAAAPDAMSRLARALGTANPVAGLWHLNRAISAPDCLGTLGMPETGIEEATQAIMDDSYANPRPPEPDALRTTIANAWAGRPPEAV